LAGWLSVNWNEKGEKSVKILITLIGCLMAGSLMAETAHFSSFGITVPDQWTHETETGSGEGWGSTLRLASPRGEGIVKITTFEAPTEVTQDRLRNLTNVEQSVPLKWQSWGELAGFQYDYSEGEHSFRQWWLTSEHTIVFVVYQYEGGGSSIDSSVLDRTVRSIASVGSP
jgi:hypothetical protein